MLFTESKYTRWYYMIIERAASEGRTKKHSVYYEGHHIVPKSLGGDKGKKNIVLLTGREHFICHLLLTKMCVQPAHRLSMLLCMRGFRKKMKGSHSYETARKLHALGLSLLSKGKPGRKLTQETKEKLRVANLGKKQSQETIQKRLEKTKLVEAQRAAKISRGNRGKKRTPEQLERYRAAQKNAPWKLKKAKLVPPP
jgi:hypothetical protein